MHTYTHTHTQSIYLYIHIYIYISSTVRLTIGTYELNHDWVCRQCHLLKDIIIVLAVVAEVLPNPILLAIISLKIKFQRHN